MTLYAASIVVWKVVGTTTKVQHNGFGIEAVSKDEAVGRALRVAFNLYPGSDGWTNHHAVCQPAMPAVEPDAACWVKAP